MGDAPAAVLPQLPRHRHFRYHGSASDGGGHQRAIVWPPCDQPHRRSGRADRCRRGGAYRPPDRPPGRCRRRARRPLPGPRHHGRGSATVDLPLCPRARRDRHRARQPRRAVRAQLRRRARDPLRREPAGGGGGLSLRTALTRAPGGAARRDRSRSAGPVSRDRACPVERSGAEPGAPWSAPRRPLSPPRAAARCAGCADRPRRCRRDRSA